MSDWIPEKNDYLLWLNPEDTESTYQADNRISLWLSQNTKGYAYQASPSNKPLLVEAESGNEVSIAYNESLDLSSISEQVVGVGRVVFVLVLKHYNTGGSYNGILGYTTGSGGNAKASLYSRNSGLELGWRRLDSDSYQGVSISAPTDDYLLVTCDFNPSQGVATLTALGQPQVGNYSSSGLIENTIPDFFRVGATNSNEYSAVDLRDLFVLVDTETETLEKIEGFLAHRWGLQSQLSPAHPYKTDAPSDGISEGATASISGVVQVDGLPASRTVRAFSYEDVEHTINSELVTSSLSLGTAVSNPGSGEYTINLLSAYQKPVFVVAFDDYGEPFQALKTLEVGDRIHPTSPNGYVWECTSAGDLPEEEPAWSTDTETGQTYGSATLIARPFYRPMAHGPVTPEVIEPAGGDLHWDKVTALLHFDGDLTDETSREWTGGGAFGYAGGKFGLGFKSSGGQVSTPASPDLDLSTGDFTIECFINLTGTSGLRALLSSGVQNWATGNTYILVDGSNRLEIGSFVDGLIWLSSATLPSSGAFHFCLERLAGELRLFVDGVLVDSELSGAAINLSTNGTRIGVNSNNINPFSGVIDELRITKGVARYTEDFTPPTEPFPNHGPQQ